MTPGIVVDASILLEAIRYEVTGDGRQVRPPAYQVIKDYLAGRFDWLYCGPIMEEYVRQFHHLRRNAIKNREALSFDTKTFNAVIDAIRQAAVQVMPTEAEEAEAYSAIMDPAREEHLRDEDDFIYLATADHARNAGMANVVIIGSDDSDLYRLGNYKGIPILRTKELIEAYSKHA